MISICINTHNEGPRLKATVKDIDRHLGGRAVAGVAQAPSLAAVPETDEQQRPQPGAVAPQTEQTATEGPIGRSAIPGTDHDFVIVADGVTDGCCDDVKAAAPGALRVDVIENAARRGCGRSKNQMAAEARGTMEFFDAHQVVISGSLAELCNRAAKACEIWTPVVRNFSYTPEWAAVLDEKNQIPWDQGRQFRGDQYRVMGEEWRLANDGFETAMPGVGFALSRETLGRLGGFNNYLGVHGSQERGIALRAFMAEVPIRLASGVIVGHEFRKDKPLPRQYVRFSRVDQSRNLWHAYYVVAGADAWPLIRQALRKLNPLGEDVTARPEVKAEREAFLAIRRKGDEELLKLLGLAGAVTQCRMQSAERRVPNGQQGTTATQRIAVDGPRARIDVRIPYEPGGQIGAAYNRIMRQTDQEWVLFLDHDVLMLNPSWYEICQEAIARRPDAGMFTGWTNNIGCKLQRDIGAPAGHDIQRHRQRAREMWMHHGVNLTENRTHLIGGFMMLVRKSAWAAVGGFTEEGFFGVDNDFHARLLKRRLPVLRIDGLYAYHLRERADLKQWVDGVDTSATLSAARHPEMIAQSRAREQEAAEALRPKRRCIYTVITGGYDQLLAPKCPLPGWELICFTDGNGRPGTAGALQRTIGDGGPWKTVVFDTRELDSRRASRLPKILPHEYLAGYDYAVYCDAHQLIKRDPVELCEAMAWPEIAICRHPDRDCVYTEGEACVRQHKATRADVDAQLARYRADGMPEGFGLWSNGFILRRLNSEHCEALGRAWWEEFAQAPTCRDQLSLPYVLWKRGWRVETFEREERSRYWEQVNVHAPAVVG